MAQTYPSPPVRILVGLPAGGTADIVVRLIAQRLSERLGQQFVVENRPVANNNIAIEALVRASADGHTLGLTWIAMLALSFHTCRTWYTFFAPKATPEEIVNRRNAATVQALADPAVKSRLADLGVRFSHANNRRRRH